MISAGRILVGGALAEKATRLVAPSEPIEVVPLPSRYVSRGGDKLAAALARFAIDPTNWRALDVGASTGGFTDCLLQHGAAHVTAIDVGTHQLHERLRTDERVRSLEQTNIRDVEAGALGSPYDLVVADLSFVSLVGMVPHLLRHAAPAAAVVLLVKPQFEATRQEADRARGVITDPAVWERAVQGVRGALEAAGAAIMGDMTSPVRGAQGNVEFLLAARVPGVR